jgi:NAD(P)-dependent dehydrogenase (short-subunit alcohol dehydrogenase family)
MDRVAVVTGAASGIGLASSRRLAAEGATVVVVDTNVDAGQALAEELGGMYVEADVTNPEDNERMYALTVRSTTPASHRPTTTRSSPRGWMPGGACRR